MLSDKINELLGINVALSVTTAWYQANMTNYKELLPHLLAINEQYDVGMARESKYIGTMTQWITDAGKRAQYESDTTPIILAATRQLYQYIAKLEYIAKNHESIYTAIESIKDETTLTKALKELTRINH